MSKRKTIEQRRERDFKRLREATWHLQQERWKREEEELSKMKIGKGV